MGFFQLLSRLLSQLLSKDWSRVIPAKAYKEAAILTVFLTMIGGLIQLNSYDFNIGAMSSDINGGFFFANVVFPIFLFKFLVLVEAISLDANGDTLVPDMMRLLINGCLCREDNSTRRSYEPLVTDESTQGYQNYQTMTERLVSPSDPIELGEMIRSDRQLSPTVPEPIKSNQVASSNSNALQEVIVDTQSWVPKVQELSDDSSTSDEKSGNSLGIDAAL